ncbi:hypothetical protein Hdeb2414_s0026g00680381 [Helianthus debilis subsp. tardiflorus]
MYTPVGKSRDLFSRRPTCICGGPSRSIKLDGITFHNRTRMSSLTTLRENFNFDEVERDLEARNLTCGIRTVLMKRYSDRKYEAKKYFKSLGGYNDIERAMAYHLADNAL